MTKFGSCRVQFAKAEGDKAIAKAISESIQIGITHSNQVLIQCLAYRVPSGSNLGNLRSALGNALAEQSASKGLEAMAMVAYVEVCFPIFLNLLLGK